MSDHAWWQQPLHTLNAEQWEALCDGCGKCCMAKLQDQTSQEVYYTNVACQLLDQHSCRCSNYAQRTQQVPDCIQLTLKDSQHFEYLPVSCAYRLRAQGQPLPDWHPLISGDKDSVHRAGRSVQGRTIDASQAGPIEHHLYDWDGHLTS
ncbi:MAG: hypothetical protein CBC79_05775 [Gammaproteobacteria bacterium TMED119]|nr:MAG: hypothetical protein CBC79_05775 [Gammaproteobacteria bacterium TMED119]